MDIGVIRIDEVTGNPFVHYSTPVESRFSGFFYIPGYTSLAISKTGELKNVISGQTYAWTVCAGNPSRKILGGYYTANTIDGTIRRHRAMMLAFKPPGIDPRRLLVNHLDGVPGHDDLDNLEWCTYSENTTHAYDTGLHSEKVVAVIAWHVDSGQFAAHQSIASAGRATGLPEDTIRKRLKRNNKPVIRIYPDGWLFKKNDGTSWPEVDPIRYNKQGTPLILVIHCSNRTVSLFESTADAGAYVGLSVNQVSAAAKKKSKVPYNGFLFRFLTDDDVDFLELLESDSHQRPLNKAYTLSLE